MPQDAARLEAIRAFRIAFRLQQAGAIDRAIYQYRRSLELVPTAEAYTYLGWAYSHQGKLADAIAACRKAIRLDPDLGNPYNDIGAYLIEMGRPQEALPWLLQALDAPRYETYCYSYFNLGRANEMLGDTGRAARCYRSALEADPTFMPARLALAKLGRSDDIATSG